MNYLRLSIEQFQLLTRSDIYSLLTEITIWPKQLHGSFHATARARTLHLYLKHGLMMKGIYRIAYYKQSPAPSIRRHWRQRPEPKSFDLNLCNLIICLEHAWRLDLTVLIFNWQLWWFVLSRVNYNMPMLDVTVRDRQTTCTTTTH